MVTPMQRSPRTPTPRVSTGMRKSMLQLQQKAAWLRPRGASLPQAVRTPRKAKSKPGATKRPISKVLEDYKEALDRLEEIEAELAVWLNDPIAVEPEAMPGAPEAATAPAIAVNEAPSPPPKGPEPVGALQVELQVATAQVEAAVDEAEEYSSARNSDAVWD